MPDQLLDTSTGVSYNSGMPMQPLTETDFEYSARGLAKTYISLSLCYLLAVAFLWILGIEAIYQHPTPFYALMAPAFSSFFVPGLVLLPLIWLSFRWLLARGEINLPRQLSFLFVFSAVLLLTLMALLRDVRESGIFAAIAQHLMLLRWNLVAWIAFIAVLLSLSRTLPRIAWFEGDFSRKQIRTFIFALVLFAFLFPALIAMSRDGMHGITQAYERQAYEYIGDIGKGRSIRGLFANYNELHPYLSMHARVHPPGPIAILWVLSYLVGQSPLGLSLATMAMGALGIVPLYFWAKDLLGSRDSTTPLTICFVYVLIPTIVLFTATSTDITFTPLTITTLFLFWRAITRNSIGYAAGAGAMYAVLSLISFSLLSIGAFFSFVGLWKLVDRDSRGAVIKTAGVMIVSALAVHFAVRWWSGFDIIECFRLSREQFYTDQIHLDAETPRFAAWTWKFLNPACWFFFAGVPVSVLFVKRLLRPESDTKALFIVFGLTLVALDILYLGRGEGERSAMYIMPFLAIPAGHYLDRLVRTSRSLDPLIVTAAFLGFQCWCMEVVLFTYW